MRYGKRSPENCAEGLGTGDPATECRLSCIDSCCLAISQLSSRKRDFKDFHQVPTQPKSGPLAVSLIFNLNTSKNLGRQVTPPHPLYLRKVSV